ncbi:DNA polymerase/3'-5' exonuclease PolX [Halobacteriaceae archaeon GCM10025711]
MSKNAEVADRLEEFADILAAQDVEFKPRAYRRAAQNVRDYPEPVEDLVADGQDAVEEIEGVGESIAEKIVEYVETGEISELEELRAELPADVEELTAVEGVGPKTVGKLYRELGIQTLDDLERAARNHEIRVVEGFGEKTEQNILEHIPFAREAQERQLLGDARPLGEEVRDYLDSRDGVAACEVAGSLRRWRATIGDVDVLAGSDDGEAVIDAFTGWDRATEVIEAGTNKASIRIGDVRVDLRVVVPDEFGSALQYFTGSKDHNIRLRNYAIDRGMKVNEYGVFDVSDIDDPDAGQRVGERVAGETEASVYEALDLPLMAPELREDRGEIQAARDGALPTLVEEADVRGDLHLHTDWSDGNNTIAEMVAGATEFGHEYICISDHATGPGIVSGVEDDGLVEEMDAVRDVAEDADIDVLTGVEANIDADGGVTVADDVLADLDVVTASIHSGMGDGGEAATDRIVTAIEHPSVDVIGHPTTRLINRRPALDIDVEAIATAAADNDVALEVNANPARLDLSGSAVKTAIEQGAKIAINTDAHSPAEYRNVVYGVHTARRGWAESEHVITTWPIDDLRAFLH